MKSAAIIAAMFAMSGGAEVLPMKYVKPPKQPKNKYNLSEEEIESLKSMSPKEKKVFLKKKREAYE